MIKCAIFDADGTLIDSMTMWRDITYEYAREKGAEPPEGLHKTMNRLSMEQCADLYRGLGVPGTTEQVMAELAACALEGYRTRVPEKPRAGELVRLLHDNGVRVAVATASHSDGVSAALERCGILPYVDFLTSCTEVGKSKESPDVFLRCAEQFGALPGESVVFEDSAYAARTAKAAGFPVVGVEDGVSQEGDSVERELRECADRYLTGYGELIRELTPPEEDFGEGLSKVIRG